MTTENFVFPFQEFLQDELRTGRPHLMPPFQKPTEIASYSLDETHNLRFDDSSLSHYFPLDLADVEESNLNIGYPEKYTERDESIPEHLDTLLKTLVECCRPEMHLGVAFVTWRGIMTRILCCAYLKDEWNFNACRVNDTIYIEEDKALTDMLKNKRISSSNDVDRQRQMCYWGYRFETVSTIPCAASELEGGRNDERVRERVNRGVNTNVQYCSVVRTQLGKHSMILGAEVDCTDGEKPIAEPNARYVELKTSKLHQNERQRMTFEKFKLLKFYFQSFLAGIPKIYVGFRDDLGIVRKVERLETLKIPRIIRQKNYWDPNLCLLMADKFLTWLRVDVMTQNDLNVEYSISFDRPFRDIIVRKRSVEATTFIASELVSLLSTQPTERTINSEQ